LLRRSKGETYEEVARRYGATPFAVRRAISSTRGPIELTRGPDNREALLAEIDQGLNILIQKGLF
jgi:hypothetical protein